MPSLLDGLDDEQRAAVTAPAGPVCILAGAGTGKTRAITYRIAHRVLTEQIEARHVLAVTFTARAAAQLRARLTQLGVAAVQARTFHAAALRQLRYFAPRLLDGRDLPEVVESKARLVTLALARVGIRSDRTAARDFASEIEWAKSSLVEPEGYAVAATQAGREPPHDAATVARVYEAYESVKRGAGVIDFEDLLRAAAWGIEEHSDVADQIRAQYRHFVVDEYQDVNPAQQRLLTAWLGDRDDLTVVGDTSQTIYSFTGATSTYLVEFARRCRGAGTGRDLPGAGWGAGAGGTLVRLVRDYRSTPQVVATANQIIRQARGDEARLRLELVGQRAPGPEPVVSAYADEPEEAARTAARCAELISSGIAPQEIAILFRTNAQSQVYEEALAEAGVAYVVRGSERFFERAEVRAALVAIRAASRAEVSPSLRESVVAALAATGWNPAQPPGGGTARERWEALAALVAVAEEFGDERSMAEFGEELARRAAAQHAPTMAGVTLASLHAAKGLEWDAVFLVGLVEGVLPTAYARTDDALEEERRLLYVGVTRARTYLSLSYAASRAPGGRQRRPSRFLPLAPGRPIPGHLRTERDAGGARRRLAPACRVCGAALHEPVDRKLGRCSTCPSTMDEELYERLRQWRIGEASAQKVPAYVVFTDATLVALAERRPAGLAELAGIAGIGPRKLDQYGSSVLALLRGAKPDEVLAQTRAEVSPPRTTTAEPDPMEPGR
jgi:DNA helicase-2/ATP-dependent DNA helicase PcrA